MVDTSDPPWNFSWVLENKLAAMAWPQKIENLQFIYKQGVKHLITLSPEKLPPASVMPDLKWTVISIQEFDPPTLEQIKQFIDICEEADQQNEGVGIHCRMGRGRTGVMGACYLVRFCDKTPQQAITTIRLMRPGSVETYQQERSVFTYHDFLRSIQTI